MDLKSDTVKTATRHKFDAGITFEKMLVAYHIAEAEVGPKCVETSTSPQAKPKCEAKPDAKANALQRLLRENTDKLQQLIDMIQTMQLRIDILERSHGNQQAGQSLYRPQRRQSRPAGFVNPPQQYHSYTRQPAPQPRTCHNCGDPAHFWKSCPHPVQNLNGQ